MWLTPDDGNATEKKLENKNAVWFCIKLVNGVLKQGKEKQLCI